MTALNPDYADARKKERLLGEQRAWTPVRVANSPSPRRLPLAYGALTILLTVGSVSWVIARAGTESVGAPPATAAQPPATEPSPPRGESNAQLIVAGHSPIADASQSAKPVAMPSPKALSIAKAPAPVTQKNGSDSAPAAADVPVIPFTKVSHLIGKTAAVEGIIIDVFVDPNKSVYLSFSSDKDAFYAVISDPCLISQTVSASDFYKGKKVRVTGRVTTFNDRPRIRICSAIQIAVVN
jgi:hypothetical protein